MCGPFDQTRDFSGLLVGLVAFQGAFHAHGQVLKKLGVPTREIRTRGDFGECTHVILPGGESTAILKLLEFHDLEDEVIKHVESGKPLLGTCAGLILIAKNILPPQESFRLLDASVERNAYGRQVDSFEADLDIPAIGPEQFHGVFIRAPIIDSVAPSVEILAKYEGKPVMVRQGKILAATFHPELSGDTRIHAYFLSI